MPSALSVRCACGSFRGVARGVSAKIGNRLVCYCDDCQSFAHALGAADRVLDAHGGTDIFQMSPAWLEIVEGREQLACLRLRPGGMLRWYASCCDAPIGNTISGRMPFVGLILSRDPASDGPERDEAIGPVRTRVNARFAKGDRAQLDAHDRAPLGLILRFVRIVFGAWLRGGQRRSPFFDPETGKPVARPRVLGEDELRRAETARDAAKRICGSCVVSSRVTHVYPDGIAPYFTVIAPGKPGGQLEQWDEIKVAVSDAIIDAGGTITHHHAVGRDHRKWYEQQRPALFGGVLADAKRRLDPHGILNPGVVV